jgi:hypothetical protein
MKRKQKPLRIFLSHASEDKEKVKQLYSTLKSAYLFLRVDQFSNKLKTKNRFADYFWSWSVCDPRRKKKVAKSQSEELRPASIVVSSFIISAYSSALDIPGIGISSDDITTGMINSLNLRYYEKPGDKGVFGTPEEIIHRDGDEFPIINPNCRHIAAAISILLRLMLGKFRAPKSTFPGSDDFSHIFAALRYLKDLSGYAIFSQDPELDSGFPDCATCAIVLELLDLLESRKDLLPYNSDNPFASPDNLKEWTTRKIQLGLDLLGQLKIQVVDHDSWFWDYSFDKKRFKGCRRGNGIPPLTGSCEEISLYHTCRLLYLLRNIISKPGYRIYLMPAVENLEKIMKENGGALPGRFPKTGSDISNITNTAFFLNSLIPDDLSLLDHRFDNLLIMGINKLSEMFNKEASAHLKDEDIELYADGIAMVLRLFCLPWFDPCKSGFVKEIKVLNDSAKRIQTYIYNNQMEMIKEELAGIRLQGCFPIIKDRVAYSRNWWNETYGLT